MEESEEQGIIISESMIEELLEKAETKAREVAQEIAGASIGEAFKERDYEMKLEVLGKKVEKAEEEMQRKADERFKEHEGVIKKEIDELKFYVKTLQTDIEEEVKRRKRDKSDIMLEQAEITKDTNGNMRDLE